MFTPAELKAVRIIDRAMPARQISLRRLTDSWRLLHECATYQLVAESESQLTGLLPQVISSSVMPSSWTKNAHLGE